MPLAAALYNDGAGMPVRAGQNHHGLVGRSLYDGLGQNHNRLFGRHRLSIDRAEDNQRAKHQHQHPLSFPAR